VFADEETARLVRGIVGFCDLAFPGRVRGYYLQGSHADGTACGASDVDLCFVLADRFRDDEEARAWRVDECCELVAGRTLDVIPTTEVHLREHADAATVMHFKLGTKLVSGEDIRDGIPLPTMREYAAACARHAVRQVARLRGGAPADRGGWCPDAALEFYGYGQRQHSPSGPVEGTVLLVGAALSIARAILARDAGTVVHSKRACVDAYSRHIGGAFAPYLEAILMQCRDRWRYRVPAAAAERHELRELYGGFAALENHFTRGARDLGA
jgi:hypothetical protein